MARPTHEHLEKQSCNYCVIAKVQGTRHQIKSDECTHITSTISDDGSRLNLLEAQIDELAERLSRVESGPTKAVNDPQARQQEAVGSNRPESASSYSTSTTEVSSSAASSPKEPPQACLSLPFALKFSTRDSRHRHPSPEQTKAIWQHYVQNIDPLFKIIQVSTVQQLFLPNMNERWDIPPDSKALKWAICFAAAASLERTNGHISSNEGLGSLSKMYQHSFETSLAKARFMAEPTFTTVQALTIYLTMATKVLDQTYVWSLTAILVRLAMKLKLHLDPETQGLQPRDSEYRRRLWWHITTLDASTAEDNETDPLIYERQCTTTFPTPIQDTALNSHATPILSTQHAPDTFPSLLRFEITYYIRTILYSPTFASENNFPALSTEGKLSIIESLQKTLEIKYYRHCTCRSPNCTLAMLLSKIRVANLTLKIRDQASPRSPSGKGAEQILQACTDIMEASRALRADPSLSPWSWLWTSDVASEFDAAGICLSTLASCRTRPTITSRAWSAIDGFFNAWKESEDPRWARLEHLRERAVKARASTISPLGRHDGKTLKRRAMTFRQTQTSKGRCESSPAAELEDSSPKVANVASQERFGPPLRSFSEGFNV